MRFTKMRHALPQFNLERLARNAAQQMIQAALELEVTEFLERGRYDKTSSEDFRRLSAMDTTNRGRFQLHSGVWKWKSHEFQIIKKPFNQRLVKPYKRRSEGLDCLFPNLFVEGLATRDAWTCPQIFSWRIRPTFAVFDFKVEQKVQRWIGGLGKTGFIEVENRLYLGRRNLCSSRDCGWEKMPVGDNRSGYFGQKASFSDARRISGKHWELV